MFGGSFNAAVTALGTVTADKLKNSKAVDHIVADDDGDDVMIKCGGKGVFHGGADDDTD